MEASLGLLLLVLKVSDDIGNALALDEVLIVTGLRVQDFLLGLNLTNCVDVVELPDDYTLNSILVEMHAAEEVLSVD